MATYNVGSGQTYSTIADAYAAVVSAVGGTAATETHYIDLYGGATFSENITLGSYWLCFVTPENPLVIRTADGESRATISGNISGSFMPYFRMEDVDFTGTIAPNYMSWGFKLLRCTCSLVKTTMSFLQSVVFEDCDIDSGAGPSYTWYTGSAQVSVLFRNCRIKNRVSLFWVADGSERVRFEGCRFELSGAAPIINHTYSGSNYELSNITFLHCSFYFSTTSQAHIAKFEIPTPTSATGCPQGEYIFRNNIFYGASGGDSRVIEFTGDGGYVGRDALEMTGNRYYQMSKILLSGDFDISTVSGMQAIGLDTYSTEGDPGFASTTWGNSNFLDISASLGTAKNVGIYEDDAATAREKWSNIDPGAHQYAAAEESAGGAQLGAFENGAWR